MSTLNLLLIADSHRPTDAVTHELTPVWDHWGAAPPRVTCCTVEQVIANEDRLDGVDLAWVYLDGVDATDDHRGLFELVGLLQERHLPVALSRRGEDRAIGDTHDEGVVVCPPDADPATLAAVLKTLASQTATLRGLSRELGMMHAQRGGLAEQIDKFDEELRLAAQLQREFLPTDMPQVPGLSFHALWRPAGYVSGDLFDVARLDERHVAFFVADAVGHGVPAALMTVFIKRSLQHKVIDPDHDAGYRLMSPGEALGRLNRDMIDRQSGKVRFATACCGVIDTHTMTLQIARAGHPFPMLLRADGSTEWLKGDGGLLGVFPAEDFTPVEHRLAPGDRLLIYSDGFEVAFPESATADEQKARLANEQYVEEFDALRHGEPDAALRRFEHKLDQQIGSLNQRDDLTVLCISVDESAAQRAAA